jgi:L-2-hydroxyglutarate oxidase LhgO
MSEQVDCVVIGAGVIGLAVARALAMAGREVLVLERNGSIGEETSSRNSEVIHAGIYYPTDSLKARLCVAGKSMLYDFCSSRNVAHKRCGKLIVATDESQLSRLDELASRARANGVDDLEPIDAAELGRREPQVKGIAALWSPSTGILDSHAFMQALEAELEAANGIVATHAEVLSVHVEDQAVLIRTRSGEEESTLAAQTVINAAGLNAVALARAVTGIPTDDLPQACFARGHYFILKAKSPFSTLVYPLPVDGGLGIHATLDLGGQLRFGPDVEWVSEISYSVDPKLRDTFADSIHQYWPELNPDNLEPGYAGIRPKLSGPGKPPADFVIEMAAGDDSRQLVHLLGIESPGLTASLAIAAEVSNRLAAVTA